MRRNNTLNTKSRNRRWPTFVLALLYAGSLLFPAVYSQTAHAATGSDFNASKIIDDSVFFNGAAVSPADIQLFLNIKVPSCDTNGTQMYSATQTRAQYSSSQGYSTPFTCLRDYVQDTPNMPAESGLCASYGGGSKTAAQIIHNVGAACGINPQVLLVLLQKEQSLVTDSWPWSIQYTKATGFSCPDTAPCDPAYSGFFYQVYHAARQFKRYARDATSFGYRAYRNNYIQFNPKTSCDGSTIYIQNQATAGLYNYTPYQPNQAALTNIYGTGDDCSAYGNRNFWRMFVDWFGNGPGPDFSASVLSATLYSDSSRTTILPLIGDRYVLQPGQTAYAKVTALNSGKIAWDSETRLGTAHPRDRTSLLAGSDWLGQQRPSAMSPSAVQPGQTASFSFSLTAPTQVGRYNERFSVVRDGITWMDALATYFIDVTQPAAPAINPSATVMTAGTARDTLTSGTSMLSSDSYTALTLTASGTLLLLSDYLPVWQAGVNAGAQAKLSLQSDGNLVLYTNGGTAVWSSGTAGKGGTTLKVQEDGNLVLYGASGAVWSTGTILPLDHSRYTQSVIPNGGTMVVDQRLQTADRKYSLILQNDGNAVLYGPKSAIWSTGTVGSGAHHMSIQSDGNLVLYTSDGRAAWSTQTAGRGGSRLDLQNDGNLVLYGPTQASWASNSTGRQ